MTRRTAQPPSCAVRGRVATKPLDSISIAAVADRGAEQHPMSRFDWERVVRRCRIPATTKLFALLLATYGNRDGSNVRPGLARLAAVSDASERTARRHVRFLEQLGLIELEMHGGTANRLANRYRLTVPSDIDEVVEMLGPDEDTPASQVDEVEPATPATDLDAVDDENPWNSGQPTSLLRPTGASLRPTDVATPATAVSTHHLDQPSTPRIDHSAALPPRCRDCDEPLKTPASKAIGVCAHCRQAVSA